MARLGRIDVASLAVEGITAAVAGGLQELAWRQRQQAIGFIVTGATLLTGVALKVMGGGTLTQQAADALYLSGASVAGWIISRKMLPLKPGQTVPYGQQAGGAMLSPGGAPGFQPGSPVGSPRYQPGSPVGMPVPRSPGGLVALPGRIPTYNSIPAASISNINPNTGEELLASRV